MKKRIVFLGFIACVVISSCAREKEGVTDDVDTATVIIDSMAIDTVSTLDTAKSGALPADPKVNVNNYKHPNLSQEAKKQQNATEGQPVDVVYKKDATGGNYKDNSNSTEVVTEKSTTTQNKIETGTTSNGGNYKNQQK